MLTLLGCVMFLIFVWFWVCIVAACCCLADFEEARAGVWGAAAIIAIMSLFIVADVYNQYRIIDDQKKEICEEQDGEWARSRCYKEGKEVEL